MSSSNKHRFWWFLLYPESCVSDWQYRITMRGLPFAVSPLHEFDLMNEAGELKKPHYHVILVYNGPTTFNNVKQLTVDELGGTIPKPLDNVRKGYEYFWHRNHPEKFQYSEHDVQCCNGFELNELVQLSERDKAELIVSIHKDIREQNIKEHYQLLDYYEFSGDFERFNFVFSHTIHFNRYITSLRHGSAKSDEEYIKEYDERR